ncbi:2-hydroxyacid dehydrogenase [Nonomuraea roseoviolacea subsp. roseoviolacea]|uniref:D-3-phosphoglycerate dehydrogenase n=1 Tax=Nonomuraea roseoviolacea subsp. carminata TaxID=160689 RepID=A0ABT1K4I6_9ACTN|nr:2-hydroxyacid dehydrogenase [Nonomuraea roseoviolacea]MCP2348911.1 D-3-phosphoglycerate dehydrogenase [Nonomuraea roseoviolacea subsp. carminata]
MTIRVLAAGDHFVTNSLLIDALKREVPGELDIRELTLPWPVVPFGPVGEVKEASDVEDELIEALRDVEVCVTQMAPLTRRVLDASPALRLFCVSRGGPVNANLEAATEAGVAVTFAPGRNAVATAEHTLALLLAATRRVPQTHADLAGGVWRGDYYRYDMVGPELDGSTVGLVGYGAIGRRVSRMLEGFGAEVLVYDPYVDDVPGKVELAELLSRSRFVSLHARATPETTGMIGAAQIALMPAGSVLVNCARGALLDYDALCDALESGHLFGAALDVFPEEPIPAGSRLLTTPNLVMTPHLAGASKETAIKAARIVAADVARYVRGEALAHCANPSFATS